MSGGTRLWGGRFSGGPLEAFDRFDTQACEPGALAVQQVFLQAGVWLASPEVERLVES